MQQQSGCWMIGGMQQRIRWYSPVWLPWSMRHEFRMETSRANIQVYFHLRFWKSWSRSLPMESIWKPSRSRREQCIRSWKTRSNSFEPGMRKHSWSQRRARQQPLSGIVVVVGQCTIWVVMWRWFPKWQRQTLLVWLESGILRTAHCWLGSVPRRQHHM